MMAAYGSIDTYDSVASQKLIRRLWNEHGLHVWTQGSYGSSVVSSGAFEWECKGRRGSALTYDELVRQLTVLDVTLKLTT